MILENFDYELLFEETLTKQDIETIEDYCGNVTNKNIQSIRFKVDECFGEIQYIMNFDFKFSKEELRELKANLLDEDDIVDKTEVVREEIVNSIFNNIHKIVNKDMF